MSPGPRVGPYVGGEGPYVDGRDAPRDPRLPPDYRADPQVDGRMAPHNPRIPADYNINPYVDARGVPYSPAIPPYYPPDRHADARGVYPQPEPSPRPPYNAVDRSADGPARQHGDQLTMRGDYPAPRLPASRPRFADAPPARRLTVGEAAKAPAPPIPAPAAPTPQPVTVAPPVAKVEPPQERPQPEVGYRVLPRSYWAGASWRWRIKRDEDGFPHDPP
jgi:hypothetical protein